MWAVRAVETGTPERGLGREFADECCGSVKKSRRFIVGTLQSGGWSWGCHVRLES